MPDGYTIGVVLSLSQTIELIQHKKATRSTWSKDFTPITGIADNPAGLLVNSQIPSKTMAEFIELIRAKPGAYSYGSAGIGTAHYMYGEVLNKIAGIKMVNVPYKGVAPAFNDLLGGHIPIAIVSLATAAPHLGGGKVRLLTVFDTKRYAKAPEVPTITEVVPNYVPGARLDRVPGAARRAGANRRAPQQRDRAHPQVARRGRRPRQERPRGDRQQPRGLRGDDQAGRRHLGRGGGDGRGRCRRRSSAARAPRPAALKIAR